MGWTRFLPQLPDEDKRRKEEQKKSRTMEDFGAGFVMQQNVKDSLDAFSRIHWQEDKKGQQSGFIAFLADLTTITRGLQGLISPKAHSKMAWLIAQGQTAFEEEDEETQKLIRKWTYEFFALLAPLIPERKTPDLVLFAYPAKPGGNVEGQKLLPE